MSGSMTTSGSGASTGGVSVSSPHESSRSKALKIKMAYEREVRFMNTNFGKILGWIEGKKEHLSTTLIEHNFKRMLQVFKVFQVTVDGTHPQVSAHFNGDFIGVVAHPKGHTFLFAKHATTLH